MEAAGSAPLKGQVAAAAIPSFPVVNRQPAFDAPTLMNPIGGQTQIVVQPYFVSMPVPAPSNWSAATGISAIALMVSLCLAGYTVRKDSKARQTSVLDDYWFRKVVGPVTVEPLLKDIQELLSGAPDDNSSSSFQQTEIDEFHKAKLKLLSDFAVNVQVMNLLEQSLGAKVAADIDAIQDIVIDYCVSQSTPGGGKLRADFRNEVTGKLLNMLTSIKEAQRSIK